MAFDDFCICLQEGEISTCVYMIIYDMFSTCVYLALLHICIHTCAAAHIAMFMYICIYFVYVDPL